MPSKRLTKYSIEIRLRDGTIIKDANLAHISIQDERVGVRTMPLVSLVRDSDELNGVTTQPE